MYIVYILKDLDLPFYIGMSHTKDRAYSHEKYAVSGHFSDLRYGLSRDYNPRKTRKIQKLLREGRKIQYDFIDLPTKEDAYKKKKNLFHCMAVEE